MLAGIAFLGAVDATFNAYSATNSSPQTSDVFGDARRRESLRWYVRVGNWTAIFLGVFSSWITRSLWPALGTVLVMSEMEWLYRRAFRQAAERAGETPAADARSIGSNGRYRVPA
jgi:hypothetical protein